MTSFFGDCLFTISLPFYFWSYLSRSIDLPFWFISVINWTVAWTLGLIFVVGLRDRSQCSSPGHLPFSSNDAFYFENLFILFFLLASILFTFFFYLLAYRRVELRKGRQMLGKRIKWLLLSIVLCWLTYFPRLILALISCLNPYIFLIAQNLFFCLGTFTFLSWASKTIEETIKRTCCKRGDIYIERIGNSELHSYDGTSVN